MHVRRYTLEEVRRVAVVCESTVRWTVGVVSRTTVEPLYDANAIEGGIIKCKITSGASIAVGRTCRRFRGSVYPGTFEPTRN